MMRRMIFQAKEELLERLRRHARERGVPAAQIVREALEHELEGERQTPLTCVGVMRSGRGDLAERVEELYEPPPWRS